VLGPAKPSTSFAPHGTPLKVGIQLPVKLAEPPHVVKVTDPTPHFQELLKKIAKAIDKKLKGHLTCCKAKGRERAR
jgi:hypothetical protein